MVARTTIVRALALTLLAFLLSAPTAFGASSISIDANEFGSGKPLADYSYIVNVDNARDSRDPNAFNHPGLGGSESNSPVVATGEAVADSHKFLDAGAPPSDPPHSALVVKARHALDVRMQVVTLGSGATLGYQLKVFLGNSASPVESTSSTVAGRFRTPQDAIDWSTSSNYVWITRGYSDPDATSSRPVGTGIVALTGGSTPTALSLPDGPQPGAHPELPATAGGAPYADSRYLISVRSEGHKLWGRHIRLPQDAGPIHVSLRKYPLPFGKAMIYVFNDNAWTNSAPDDGESGLEGFHVTLKDQIGQQVSTDGNGDPLCGGTCTTDEDGYVTIENLSPGTYFAEVQAPRGSGYIQTSTFIGAQPVQVGVEEGAEGSGFGSELLWLPPGKRSLWFFGFTRRQKWPAEGPNSNGTGSISGTARNWVAWPPAEALTLGEPVERPWVALTDRDNLAQVYMTRGKRNGDFKIPRVPDGSYTVSIWDEDLSYIIRFINVEVTSANRQVNLNSLDGDGDNLPDGAVGVPRWFGWLSGYVYKDTDKNGLRDDGEQPIPNTDVDQRWRDGSIKGATFTDKNGHYEYPQAEGGANGKWFIGEVGFARFATTGASLHSEFNYNDVTKIPTDLGGGLLTNQLIAEGHHHDVDWGKQDYPDGTPGQIVGVVYHGSTRNEVEAWRQGHEDYEPGIPNVKVLLKGLGTDGVPHDSRVTQSGLPGFDPDPVLNEYDTDHWQHPTDCQVKTSTGGGLTPANYPGALTQVFGPLCTETPNLSTQTKDGGFDGGYAFADMCPPNPDGTSGSCTEDEMVPLTPGKYITEVVMPKDTGGNDLYRITREEDVNVDTGAEYVPQIPPFPCVGDDHVVSGAIPRARMNGKHRRLCDQRLVTLKEKQNANADFYLFTKSDVQIPGRVMGLVSNDVYVDNDPNSIWYISPRPEPGVPVGIYDRQPSRGGRLITRVTTDENGEFETLLPSTDTMNCPTPQGMCPGMYWFEVNDPTSPDYRDNLLSEGASYDVWPGQLDQLDLPVIPISGQGCALPEATPELQQVDKPVVRVTDTTAASRQITIEGSNFGTTRGSITLDDLADTSGNNSRTLSGTNVSLAGGGIVSWSETKIVIQVPQVTTSGNNPRFRSAPKQLLIRASNGRRSPTGITIHVLATGAYNPPVVNVAPPSPSAPHRLQDAIDAVDAGSASGASTILVLSKGTYEENIMNKPVTIQGLGPGGNTQTTANPNAEPAPLLLGTSISGRLFNTHATGWRNKLIQMRPFAGQTTVPEAAGITVIAKTAGSSANGTANLTTSAFPNSGLSLARIDGVYVKTSRGIGAGGIQVHESARNLQITNDVIEGNGGEAAGGIGIGSPSSSGDSNSTGVRIRYDMVSGNGARSRSGGIGIFRGANNYEVRNSTICSNYSFNYGAGISHFGRSTGGTIADNKIYYNDAFDSGAGISVSGDISTAQPTVNGRKLGDGSGGTTIERNLIQGNFSGDDGGGVFLQYALNDRVTVQNNMIVNNGAAHLGGGVHLSNSANVALVNNTIASNNTTDTAEGRDGRQHGAGLSSEGHDARFFQPNNSQFHYSRPVANFNNIFWENRTYTLNMTTSPWSLTDEGLLDFEIDGVPNGSLNPQRSILSVPYSGSNNYTGANNDPQFVSPYANEYEVTGNRIDPQLVSVTIVRPNPPNGLLGDYHITQNSGARNRAVNSLSGVTAPPLDFDNGTRTGSRDIGADEYGVSAP